MSMEVWKETKEEIDMLELLKAIQTPKNPLPLEYESKALQIC